MIPDGILEIGEGPFFGQENLAEIDIPKSVKKIGDKAFCECERLTLVNIPEGVSELGAWAFSVCEHLKSVSIPSSVRVIGTDVFNGCSELAEIKISKANPVYDSRGECNAIIETFSNNLHSGCRTTKIPDTVTSIGARSFVYCIELTEMVVPDGVKTIGEEAFHGCSKLSRLRIPASVTSIGASAIGECRSLPAEFVRMLEKRFPEIKNAPGWLSPLNELREMVRLASITG